MALRDKEVGGASPMPMMGQRLLCAAAPACAYALGAWPFRSSSGHWRILHDGKRKTVLNAPTEENSGHEFAGASRRVAPHCSARWVD